MPADRPRRGDAARKRVEQSRGDENVNVGRAAQRKPAPEAVARAVRVSNRAEREARRGPRGQEGAEMAQGIGEPELPPVAPPPPSDAEAAPDQPILPAWVASYTNSASMAILRKHGPELMAEAIPAGDTRRKVADTEDTTAFPWRCLCRLDILASDGTRWLGTGWFASPTLIVTAGHCVYLKDAGGWADHITVVPAANDGSAPYGSFDSSDLHTTDLFMNGNPDDPNTQAHDYGAIVLPQAQSLGFFGYGVYSDAELSSALVNVYGYPGDKDNGSALWGVTRNLYKVAAKQIFYNLATWGGQSGCPVFIKVGDDRTAVGIHNYGGDPANYATRITDSVYDDLEAWKAGGD